MKQTSNRQAPGRVRDAIIQVLKLASDGLSAKQIAERVASVNGPIPESSIRSYLLA
jgi:DNA-binding NarL/FixJ family response regulator